MKILILHSSSDLYGASKILLTYVRFAKSDNEFIVVLSEEGELATLLRDEGIEVIILKLGILRRKYMNVKGLINRIFYFYTAFRGLKKIIREKEIDIVYSNTIGVLVGAFASKSAGVKHVWHVHEIVNKPHLFVRFIGFMLNNFSTKVIVVSNEVKKCWVRFVSPSKITIIHNGIDYSPYIDNNGEILNEIGVSKDTILIGMIGRVHTWKGQIYFLEIANKLLKINKNIKFVMVGDVFPGYEYLYDEINDFINKNNLTNYIIDLGFRKDIDKILNSLDIFILPSILPDPLPTVILEAMASGKPVVATNHGGALEMVVDQETGLFIPFDDAQKAADIIQTLIADKDKMKVFGVNGQKRVISLFSLQKFKQEMNNIFV